MTIEEFARRIKKLMADIPQPFSNYLAEAIAPEVKAKVKGGSVILSLLGNIISSFSTKLFSIRFNIYNSS